jgi:DNA modification methylase
MESKNRVKELRNVKASQLLPHPKNWRMHPEAQKSALRGLIDQVGYADALVARETDEGLVLMDGHLRAETTPDMEVPVLIVDVTEEEADLILATHDPLGAMAEHNQDRLSELLESISPANDEVSRLLESIAAGYEPLTLIDIEPEEETFDVIGGIEEVEDEEYISIVQTGDIWLLGEHRLMCGDSTSFSDVAFLMNGQNAEMLFTDPPYNVDYSSKNELLNLYDKGNRIQRPIANDNQIDSEEYAKFCSAYYLAAEPFLAHANSIYICGNYESLIPYYKLGNLKISNMLVWVKHMLVLGRMDYQNQHEFILYGWVGRHKWYSDRKQTTVWEFPKPMKSDLHPTMKPVELVEKAVLNSSEPNNLIYDPFVGSGTTLMAAERLGRRCYAMELEPRYCDVTIKRWEDYTGLTARKVDK